MKLKKIISGFLCSAMMLSTAIIGVSVNATDELPFTDVPDTWYTDAVKCVYNEGIMKGKSETAFDPTAKITRAEVVTAFSRVAITKTSGMGENLPFDDTVSGQWYSDSVGWAAENGIVTGRGNGIFSPADNITRAELASILTKFVNYMGIDLPDAPKLDKFADADTFDSWMISPIEAVRKNGLMQGTDGKFNPKGNATRAEIAQVIMNLLPATGRSIIAENGMSDYVIVIDEANKDALDAAERLVWQADELCGVTLDVVDDGVKATAKEIILGKTSRGTKINTSDMILDGYEIAIDGDKIFVDGKTADGLYGGVVSLLNTCISGNGMRFTSKSACVYEDKYPIGKLTIAGNDISKYTIYYPADAGENLVGAVEDMAIIIEDACGVKLPIKTGTAADYGIIIETVKSDKEFDDSFTVKNAGTNIVISGHENLGAVHGIYDLLEEYLGARYLSEADYGKYPSIAYICEAESLDLSGINYTEEPYFTYRVNCATTNRAASISKTFRDITWATPNCHTFGYFATEDGIYNNDVVPCLSDENMKTRIVTRLREWIDNYIGRTGEIPDAVSLSYADTSAYCKCDSCEEVNNKYDSPASTLIIFMNEVCRDFEDEYPDMIVQTLAYWHTLEPPKGLKAHKNIVVQYCTIENCYNHSLTYNCYYNSKAGDQIKGWSEVADELFVWDYAWNWAYNATPYPIVSYEDVMLKHQFLYENNVNLIFQNNGGQQNGASRELCTYMYNLAIWNPYMSEEDYYRYMLDACLGLYGEGGKYVYDAINLLEEKYDRCLISEQTPYEAMMHMYMRSYIDELISLMESARLLAETKYQWEKVDCDLMQFEHVKLDMVFKTMYNSDDASEREKLQDMCRTLYAKYLRYGIGVSNNVPNFPMPSEFRASPSYWRSFAYACIDKNGDGIQDDWYYDEDGNWLYDELPW